MMFRIRVETDRHEFISKETYPDREAARAEIRRRRSEGGWDKCRFYTTPESEWPQEVEPR